MATKEELEGLKVAELREKCKELAIPSAGVKADLIARILEATAGSVANEGLEQEQDANMLDDAETEAGGADAPGAATEEAAPASKHTRIIFGAQGATDGGASKKITLDGVGSGDLEKVSEMSAEERRKAREERFKKDAADAKAAGLPQEKPAKATAPVVSKEEEEAKALQRKQRFGKLTDAEARRLDKLKMSVGKSELMDPEKLKAREAKFGKSLVKTAGSGAAAEDSSELLKKRAERFGNVIKSTGDDEARKKARLERFKKVQQGAS